MAQQINEITKIPSNSEVIKILNQIIKRYNSLGDLYQYKGSVQTYDDLLAIQNPQIGDVYNIIQEDAEEGIAAGSNFAWNGTEWDNLGMGMDGLVKKINGFTPDDLGVVIFQYIKTIEDDDGTLTVTIRNGEEESTLTIDTGKVKTVNGVPPDESGDITIDIPQPTITLDMVYPVGSIYLSTNATNPTVLFGGTWEAYAQGRVLIGAGTGTDSRSEKKTFTAGSTGGEYNHQLTVGELASHNHTGSATSTNLTGKATEDTGQFQSASGIISLSNSQVHIDSGVGGGGYRTININASHGHTVTVNNTGSGSTHNNIQPYISVYIWHRTA